MHLWNSHSHSAPPFLTRPCPSKPDPKETKVLTSHDEETIDASFLFDLSENVGDRTGFVQLLRHVRAELLQMNASHLDTSLIRKFG